MLSFRATPALRALVKERAESLDVSQDYVLGTLVEWGLELDLLLDPIWDQVLEVARAEGCSTAMAVARLAERGLAKPKR